MNEYVISGHVSVCVTGCLLGVETNVAAARKRCILQRKCSVKGGASTDPASCAVSPVNFPVLSSAMSPHSISSSVLISSLTKFTKGRLFLMNKA